MLIVDEGYGHYDQVRCASSYCRMCVTNSGRRIDAREWTHANSLLTTGDDDDDYDDDDDDYDDDDDDAKLPTWVLHSDPPGCCTEAPALLHHCPRGCCKVAHLGTARCPCLAASWPTWVAPTLLRSGPHGCYKKAHMGAAKRPQPAAKWPTWVLQNGPNLLQNGPPGCCKKAPTCCKRCSVGRLYEGGQFVYFVRPKAFWFLNWVFSL